eukprot:TRINITY_DN1045_c0_g1_i8.p1 TRINITY_DN1045_c0_g1~~TRINITY_DN1045_c0_g1_i8.p1  ORF type:complete len:657 (-),score=112.36 TRINITY_DN1045_c0_g1_i8:312-2243(-)
MSKFTYPSTKSTPVKEKYGDVEVETHFNWLENPSDTEVEAWVKAQNKVFYDYLENNKDREKIKQRMTDMYNYAKYSVPFKRGDNYYFYKNDGLQNQSVLYVQKSLDGEAHVFIDPNTFSEDGTKSLGQVSFSETGKYVAYNVSTSGSDWQIIEIKATNKDDPRAKDLNEKLEWIKFSSTAWTHDDVGFFYCRYPSLSVTSSLGTEVNANKHQKVYYHRLGTPQSQDILIYETPEEPDWLFGVEVSDDGKYFFLTIYKDCDPVNKFYYTVLSDVHLDQLKGLIPVNKLIDTFEAEYSYITHDKNNIIFKTNLKSPKYKVISLNIETKERKDIIPEGPNVLSYTSCVNHNYLIVCFMENVVDVIQLHSLDGSFIKKIPLNLGSVASISSRKQDDMFFYKFVSFLEPGTIYRYDFNMAEESRLSVFRQTEIKGFDASKFQVKQVFYPSKDGTKIPMFIVSKTDLKLDGNNPVLLYGYGGFNYALQPYFSTFKLIWMQNLNGIYAIANIRGGGEFGEDWHKAGVKEKKQNVFDDFCAAAEYLAAEKYTNPKKICINGDSNGGLLVGACINQRPELFGCAVAGVGVMDMLKFHKYTIGAAWCSDFGCADNPEDFKYLIKYSPVHNVKKGKPYPAVLLNTADHDDRVIL